MDGLSENSDWGRASGANVTKSRKASNRFMRQYNFMADEKQYSAEYLGSGTFIISKPKRKSGKLRQSRLKKPRRGARK